MGDGFVDNGPMEVLHLLNMRFAPGKALDEMVQLQKSDEIFKIGKPLQESYMDLNTVPSQYGNRKRFFEFLKYLESCKSEIEGMNGHDRIITLRRVNLLSDSPLPIYTKTHSKDTDARVLVTKETPIAHELQEYWVISSPTKPV